MRISDWSSDVCSSDLSFSQGASGFTLKGAWGHDEQYLYRPGTYIFETPGVIHQLLNGPEESEILFFGDLALDFVDPETLDVISVVTADKIIDKYLQKCAEKGVIPNYRSEEHTSELQSLMRISYAVFCLKKNKH